MHAARARLALWYSIVVFGLAAAMVTALYFICGAALTRRSLADEVARTGGVVDDGRFIPIDALPGTLAPFEDAANRATLDTLRTLLTWALAGLFLISLGVGWLIAGRVLAPIDAALRAQQRFVADAGHELRNPLAVIRTNNDLLVRGAAPDSPQEHIARRVDRACLRMTAMVDDLLTLARWEVPQRSRDLVDLGVVLARLRDEFRSVAAEAGVSLTGTDTRDLVVLGEAGALHQAVANLVDNAVKHGPPGSVVTVAGTRTSGEVRVRVHNAGPPIPAEQQARVFDRFWRGTDRGAAGTGLGLSIVQRIAAGHGGSVSVESRPDAGTTFTLLIPAARRDGPAAPKPHTPAIHGPTTSHRGGDLRGMSAG